MTACAYDDFLLLFEKRFNDARYILSPFLFHPLRIFGPGMAFVVDRDPAKLAHYLQKKSVSYTREALEQFVKR